MRTVILAVTLALALPSVATAQKAVYDATTGQRRAVASAVKPHEGLTYCASPALDARDIATVRRSATGSIRYTTDIDRCDLMFVYGDTEEVLHKPGYQAWGLVSRVTQATVRYVLESFSRYQ